MADLRDGDTVTWNTQQKATRGRIVEIGTEHTEVEGRTLETSERPPSYVDLPASSVEPAGHTADALTKVS